MKVKGLHYFIDYEKDSETKFCPICNNSFETFYDTKIYCSKKCKAKAYRKRLNLIFHTFQS